MAGILIFAERLLFWIISISVCYSFVFAFFSLFGRKKRYPVAVKQYRFLVLIPAYKEDKVIFSAVESILDQDYPAEKIDIIVISDGMADETNQVLSEMPVLLLTINPATSSKANALNYAMEHLERKDYNVVVILDADNTVKSEFISEINDAFYSGASALQTHRTAKNLDNDIAILDAVSEEINNSIFRKGHTCLGFSSALVGSGMAFEFSWFVNNITKLNSAGEDKELEILLLKERIYIDYLDYVIVYDEKTRKERAFYNQRRRWLAAQFESMFAGLRYIPQAVLRLNLDYIDKIFQWMLLPKIILLGLIVILVILTSIVSIELSFRWWLLLFVLLTSFVFAIPGFLITKRNIRVINKLPVLFLLMFINLLRLKGANKKFIHTEKG